jgi:Protein tyrosine and serine/threonine kinase
LLLLLFGHLSSRFVLSNTQYSSPKKVWSWGVVVFEIFNGASIPYPEIATNAEVMEFVSAGERMDLGKRLDSKSLTSLAELVNECWHQDPKSRPTLSDITLRARKLLTELGDASTEGGSSKKANKSVLKELARDGHGAESVYDLGRDATPSGVTDSIYAEIDSQTRRPRAADALQYQNLLRGVEVGEVIGEGEVPVFPAASIPFLC